MSESNQIAQDGSESISLEVVGSSAVPTPEALEKWAPGSLEEGAAETALDRFTPADWADLESLTERQRRFVFEYPTDFNATAAAGRAGYRGDDNALGVQGHRVLRHRKAGPLVRKLSAFTADELGITREKILSRLDELSQRALDDFENPHAAAKALELLAKLRGDMIERRQVEGRTVAITINDVDMEDLR